jgi:hypothetical protein
MVVSERLGQQPIPAASAPTRLAESGNVVLKICEPCRERAGLVDIVSDPEVEKAVAN